MLFIITSLLAIFMAKAVAKVTTRVARCSISVKGGSHMYAVDVSNALT